MDNNNLILQKMKQNKRKRWSHKEDQRLLRQIKLYPQNLHKCFLVVAEITGRTEGAVANRWYSKLSKDPDALCFFTASSKHVSRNRKNGEGVRSTESVWKKLINVLSELF